LKTNDDTAILHNVSKETAIRVSFDKEKKTKEVTMLQAAAANSSGP
jgi:hypothetical protein